MRETNSSIDHMTPAETPPPQQEPALKIVEQAIFDAGRINRMFKEAMGPSLAIQEQIQKALDAQQPMIDAAVKQANALATAYELGRFHSDAFLKQFDNMHASITSLVKATEIPVRIPQIPSITREIILPPTPQPQLSEQQIIDGVSEKVITHIERRVDLKKSLLNVEPAVLLPDGFKWKDVAVHFINSHDVHIYYQEKSRGKYSHEQLGFVRSRTKTKQVDNQWKFLQHLSSYYKNEKEVPTIELIASRLGIDGLLCMKRKGNLAEQLQISFGTTEPPFYDYDPQKGYRTKFQLMPVAELRWSGELRPSGGEYIENKDVRTAPETLD